MFFAVFCFRCVGLYQVSTHEVCIVIKKCVRVFEKRVDWILAVFRSKMYSKMFCDMPDVLSLLWTWKLLWPTVHQLNWYRRTMNELHLGGDWTESREGSEPARLRLSQRARHSDSRFIETTYFFAQQAHKSSDRGHDVGSYGSWSKTQPNPSVLVDLFFPTHPPF